METLHINLKDKNNAGNIIAKRYTSAQAQTYTPEAQVLTLWQKFMRYAEAQQVNRFAWLAFSFFMQGCVLVPVTLLIVVHRGNPFELWIPTLVAFVVTETTNLAAMPTRITVPVFWASVIVDLLVIATAFLLY